jgi:pyrimidine deaminase RibD-like protein
MLTSIESRFMQAALLEGRKALPLCLPNPPVGCVLVKDGEIIARGHTQPPGMNHAEAMALAQISGNLAPIVAYVTLEPCSFQGKTPSCAKTLVASGIKRVIVAMLDPDPRNAGAGIQILQAGGIDVSVGLLGHEAASDLAPYLLFNY